MAASNWLKAYLLIAAIALVDSHRKLHLQFQSYSSDGRTAAGVSCDPPYFKRPGIEINDPCDPKFQVRVDRIFRGDQLIESRRQLFVYHQSGSYSNQNNINFVDRIGDARNPLEFEVNYTDNQSYMQLTVRVLDQDGDEPGEIMADFSAKLVADGEDLKRLNLLSKNNHSLSLLYWFACSPNFYTPSCNKHCEGSDDDKNGHTWCNEDGETMCRYGWVNVSSNCTQLHPCRVRNLCKNSGVCVPKGGEDYWCHCIAGSYGSHCENCYDGASKCSNTLASGTMDPNDSSWNHGIMDPNDSSWNHGIMDRGDSGVQARTGVRKQISGEEISTKYLFFGFGFLVCLVVTAFGMFVFFYFKCKVQRQNIFSNQNQISSKGNTNNNQSELNC